MPSRSAPARGRLQKQLRLTEIFLSLQGESTLVGWPTTFIRLTGCPLRCGYCDTAYAFQGGQVTAMDDILAQVERNGVPHVCVTGGEPLAQPQCLDLLTALCDAGYVVSLETSGALDISGVDPRVIRVMDLKTPGSGEVHRNRMENVPLLNTQDQVKFVLCDRQDYEWSLARIAEYQLSQRCTVLFSPSHGQLEPRELADWMLADRVDARLQLQLHKLLWGGVAGH